MPSVKKILFNQRGDFNLQYSGITAIAIPVLVVVATIGGLILAKWESIEAALSTIF